MKCKQPHPDFEFEYQSPFSFMITVITLSKYCCGNTYGSCISGCIIVFVDFLSRLSRSAYESEKIPQRKNKTKTKNWINVWREDEVCVRKMKICGALTFGYVVPLTKNCKIFEPDVTPESVLFCSSDSCHFSDSVLMTGFPPKLICICSLSLSLYLWSIYLSSGRVI